MSADLLRRAAAKMREHATAATPGQWEVMEDQHREYAVPEVSVWSTSAQAYVTEDVLTTPDGQFRANAEHIASWHPAAALAVADWLDVTASDVGTSSLAFHAAVAFARAYLGEVD